MGKKDDKQGPKPVMAKCVVGFERQNPMGGYWKFEAGRIYDVHDLPDETIRQYFEHPEKSPPKGLQTREG